MEPPAFQAAPARAFRGGYDPVALDNQLEVLTPENISFQHSLAGPFQRILSFGLDLVLVQFGYWIIVIVLAMIVFPAVGVGLGFAAPVFADIVSGLFLVLIMIGAFLVSWFYGVYMETYFNGRTLGKMICRQRVLTINGSAIDGRQAVIRNFFRAIDLCPWIGIGTFWGATDLNTAFPIPTCLAGIIMMCVTKDFRRIGDLVAGTIVVSEEKRGAHEMRRFDDPRVAQLAEILPTDFLVDKDLASALSSYVERRNYLGVERSTEIARRIAPKVLNKSRLPEDTNPDLLLCALYHRTFLTNLEEESTVSPGSEIVAMRVKENYEEVKTELIPDAASSSNQG